MSLATITKESRRIWSIIVITVLLAACSLLYELLIAQTMALLAANTVVWYSTVIGVYLAAMGIGSVCANVLMRAYQRWTLLIVVELLLTFLGCLSVPIIRFGHMGYTYFLLNGSESLGIITFFGSAFVMCSIIGFLTGIELPLLVRLTQEEKPLSDRTNVILAADYLGALLGGIAFPLLLKPFFEPFSAAVVIASINLAVASYVVVSLFPSPLRVASAFIPIAICAALIISESAYGKQIEQYFLRRYYYYQEVSVDLKSLVKPNKQLPRVLRASSPYQKIDLVKIESTDVSSLVMPAYSNKNIQNRDFPRNYYLFLNGDFQFGSNFEEVYHEYFAHLPMMARGKVPHEVLVLGGGDGLLIRELLRHKEINRITHVDLDRTLVGLAKENPVMTELNQRALFADRVHTIFGDGYQYMRTLKKSFDAIYIDFPLAVDYDLSRLYSAEFYHFVKRALKPTGYAVFDATGLGLFSFPDPAGNQIIDPSNDWPRYYNTLKAAGFSSVVPYVSNLEFYNEGAAEILRQNTALALQDPTILELAVSAQSSSELEVLIGLFIRKTLIEHALSLQQGFIIMTNDNFTPSQTFSSLGIDYNVLNDQRYARAFSLVFPTEDHLQTELVNLIMRPTFPTLPIWMPRLPF